MKRDIAKASKFLIVAATAGQPKAIYQVARLFHKGIGFKKDLHTVLFLDSFYLLLLCNSSAFLYLNALLSLLTFIMHVLQIL